MSRSALDSEMAIDLSVNLIPMAILIFFVGVFAVFNPWGFNLLHSSVQFAIMLSMIGGIGFATYMAARVIERDEHTRGDPPKAQ